MIFYNLINKSNNILKVINMNFLLLIIFALIANNSLAKESKEFCLYGYEGITRVVDPYYTNSNNEIVYYETIEEYAKFVGPT